MKVAVTYENGEVFQHFGHTETFKIYTIEDKKIVSSEVVGADGFGHCALADFLMQNGITTIICGGIGPGAVNALNSYGITVFAGNVGKADDVVNSLLNGTLAYNPFANCSHHDQEGQHNCGEHSCHSGNCHH